MATPPRPPRPDGLGGAQTPSSSGVSGSASRAAGARGSGGGGTGARGAGVLVLWCLVAVSLVAAWSGLEYINAARATSPTVAWRSGGRDDEVGDDTLHLLTELSANASSRVPHRADLEFDAAGADPGGLPASDDGEGDEDDDAPDALKQLRGSSSGAATAIAEPLDPGGDAEPDGGGTVAPTASAAAAPSTASSRAAGTTAAVPPPQREWPSQPHRGTGGNHSGGGGGGGVRFGWLGASYHADAPGLAAARARAVASLFASGYEEGPERPSDAAERAGLGDHPAAPGVALRVNLQVLRDFRPWRKHGIAANDLVRTREHRAQLIERVGNESSGMVSMYVRRGVPFLLDSELAGPLQREYGVGSKGKLRSFIEMLAAIGRVYPLPDVHFIWNVHPWPLLRTAGGDAARGGGKGDGAAEARPAPRGLAPILSLCKTDADLDVLYPNMYFGTPRYWWRTTRSLERAAGNWAWARRRDKMWWRGASGWMWPQAAPRVLTVAQWHSKAWADFAFTSNWRGQLRDWEKQNARWLRALPRGARLIPAGGGTRTTMEAVAKYKYALHLPGSYGATYSRTLQFLVWTGTAIFFYDCPYYEFYYHDLRPYEHYIPVNLTSLGNRLAWAQHHPEQTAAIAAASQRFAREHLTAGHIALYWGQLLEEYASLQRFSITLPPDACTCWPTRQGASAAESRPAYLPRGTRRCKWVCDYR